jgi:hypothetical protein
MLSMHQTLSAFPMAQLSKLVQSYLSLDGAFTRSSTNVIGIDGGKKLLGQWNGVEQFQVHISIEY